MTGQTEFYVAKRVLVVDDDTVCRAMLARGLSKLGYETASAGSAQQAREMLQSRDGRQTDCVISDYRMPDENGVELLRWLKSFDSSISTIMLTSEGDKQSIAQMLREGAVDYLDKPIEFDDLRQSVENAIARTRKRREMRDTVSAVDQVSQTMSQLIGIDQLAALDEFRICYRPMHQAGGDFVNAFTLRDGRRLILVSDVSGHDLNAAYISSYFQGMVRGMIEKEAEIGEILAFFNRFLVEEWNGDDNGAEGRESVSLAVCAAVIDPREQSVSISNFGCPAPLYVDALGKVHTTSDCGSPLGWFPEPGGVEQRFSYADGGYLFFRSDGLDDLALDLGASENAVAYRLLHSDAAGRDELLKLARDDILVVCFDLERRAGAPDGLQPILVADYPGDQAGSIDAFQRHWDQSIRLALPWAEESRLYDALLCIRETVLNAMQHGCSGRADRTCRLGILYSPPTGRIHVHVIDPGEGFEASDRDTPFSEDGDEDLHCGCILIRNMPDHYETARNGAVVRLEFDIFQAASTN